MTLHRWQIFRLDSILQCFDIFTRYFPMMSSFYLFTDTHMYIYIFRFLGKKAISFIAAQRYVNLKLHFQISVFIYNNVYKFMLQLMHVFSICNGPLDSYSITLIIQRLLQKNDGKLFSIRLPRKIILFIYK